MNEFSKYAAGILAGSALTFGAGELTQDAQVADASADKQAILKMYVDSEIRLGEIPTLDLSVASADEMSRAYGDLAIEQDAFTKDNLFESLHDKAVLDGTACK